MCYGDPYHSTDGEYLRYLDEMQNKADQSALDQTIHALDEVFFYFWDNQITEEEARERVANIVQATDSFEDLALLFIERIAGFLPAPDQLREARKYRNSGRPAQPSMSTRDVKCGDEAG